MTHPLLTTSHQQCVLHNISSPSLPLLSLANLDKNIHFNDLHVIETQQHNSTTPPCNHQFCPQKQKSCLPHYWPPSQQHPYPPNRPPPSSPSSPPSYGNESSSSPPQPQTRGSPSFVTTPRKPRSSNPSSKTSVSSLIPYQGKSKSTGKPNSRRPTSASTPKPYNVSSPSQLSN